MSAGRTVVCLVACSIGASACGGAHPPGPESAPSVAQTTGAANAGHINARVLSAAQGADTERIVLHAALDGKLTKVSVSETQPTKAPEAVRRLVEAKFPGSQAKSYEIELYATEGWAHELEIVTKDGRECEVSATDAGVFRYVSCHFAETDLPKEVSESISRTVPEGAIISVKRTVEPRSADWKITLKEGDVVHKLTLAPDGSVRFHGVRIPATIEIPKL